MPENRKPETRPVSPHQPAAGLIATAVIVTISLAFISLFELSTFTGWVAYCIECVIPMQIVIGITWATKHPRFAASRSQPARGVLLALITLVAGVITGTLFFYTVNGGINPPTPFLLMFIIIVVLTTFAASIMWGGWPFMSMIARPVPAGLAMLASCYLVAYVIFRVSSSYYVQDGVVPRTQVAPTLRYIAEVAKRHDVRISNIFHAGDGNLHPIILFNSHLPGELDRARAAGEDILSYCISVGGSITGEHGVGMEKNELMDKLFPASSIDYMKKFKSLFDPQNGLNPGKVLPTGRGCLEIRQAPFTRRTAV